jgi:hypothetical protein
MQSLRSIRVIDGSPTMSADLMVALVKRARECEYFQLIESTPDIATYETKRHGSLSPTRMSFTIDEAREAQLTGKDNWKKYRAAMLRARASAALCRVEYPDLMLGIYETDELDSGEDYSRPAAADTPGLECGPADRLHSFDAMIRPAKKTMDPELNVIPEPQEFQELTAHVDEAAQLSERILAAASVEELSAVGKAISEALSSKRISQKNRFDLMGLYRSHRKQITNPSTPEMDTIEVAQ